MKQTFATKKGQKYRVTFSMAGNPEGKVSEKVLGIAAAGQEDRFTFDTKDRSRKDLGWTTQVWDFTAAADKTTLEIYTLMDDDGNYGPAVDDVRVTTVED